MQLHDRLNAYGTDKLGFARTGAGTDKHDILWITHKVSGTQLQNQHLIGHALRKIKAIQSTIDREFCCLQLISHRAHCTFGQFGFE